jgi:nucleotide-binding universal stress UspA family protein
MTLTRILVAINTPNGRDGAFERALALAGSSGAELYLLHAVPPDQPFSFHAAARLDGMAGMRERAERAGLRVETAEQHGDPAEIIELHANAREADLIVMGSEPRRGWGRRRSAVAEAVIRRTGVPTLVVPSDAAGEPAGFRNVLVALDLSPASKDVLRAAIDMTAREPARLTVIHTVKGLEAADAIRSPARWAVPEYRALVLEDAQRTLQALVSEVRGGIDTRVQVWAGSPARAILERAAGLNADLVVLGRSRGFKVLGSTALRVLRRNDRALLLIPGPSSIARRVGGPLAA